MKKKNLIILLIFPFLIAVFCIVTVNTTYNKIDVDISYIEWEYKDMHSFQISDGDYLLTAYGVNQRYYKVSGDDSLVWFVENSDGTEDPYAEIVEKDGKYYLRALKQGQVTVTCSNKKGTVYRQMTGIVYKDAAILLYPKLGGSQNNIDSKIYYGEYDHTIGNAATIEMELTVVPESSRELINEEATENIEFDRETGLIRITGTGSANLTLSLPGADPRSFSFEIVDEGVNVYTYDDLLYCTNKSDTGHIAVLRKSFESLENTYVLDDKGAPLHASGGYAMRSDTVECFGRYNEKTKSFDFSDDVDYITTTYNKNYIEQWNEFAKGKSQYKSLTDQICVGLHVKKDFYGNGFTLNLHNLTYPYSYRFANNDAGETVRLPLLTSANLFRGPLHFYSLGDPNQLPLVTLYGQDNIGMYVHGDNITVNDVNLKNCEFGDRIANLSTVGTVMEISGNGVTVKNCRISNGKNVVRSFSSQDLTLSNCMLSYSQNFLFLTGANEYIPVDTTGLSEFYMLDGEKRMAAISAFLEPGVAGSGDEIINKFLTTFPQQAEERANMKKALLAIQSALDSVERVKGDYKGSTTIDDCFFYQSGVSAIGLESLFNSPFLETTAPSLVSKGFEALEGMLPVSIPYTPTHVSGTSYPVRLDVTGDTRFYDYKQASHIELEGMLKENITGLVRTHLPEVQISLDDVFPLKSQMLSAARNHRATYRDPETGTEYVNIPVAYYGGGANLSTVTFDKKDITYASATAEVDLLDRYLSIPETNDTMQKVQRILWKTVITVTGFEPFRFNFVQNGYLYGEAPKVMELIANAKENQT